MQAGGRRFDPVWLHCRMRRDDGAFCVSGFARSADILAMEALWKPPAASRALVASRRSVGTAALGIKGGKSLVVSYLRTVHDPTSGLGTGWMPVIKSDVPRHRRSAKRPPMTRSQRSHRERGRPDEPCSQGLRVKPICRRDSHRGKGIVNAAEGRHRSHGGSGGLTSAELTTASPPLSEDDRAVLAGMDRPSTEGAAAFVLLAGSPVGPSRIPVAILPEARGSAVMQQVGGAVAPPDVCHSGAWV